MKEEGYRLKTPEQIIAMSEEDQWEYLSNIPLKYFMHAPGFYSKHLTLLAEKYKNPGPPRESSSEE